MKLQPFDTEITPQEFEELRQVVAHSETELAQPIFDWLYDHNIIALESEMIEMILIYKMECRSNINHLITDEKRCQD
jgi:hypothetical protein